MRNLKLFTVAFLIGMSGLFASEINEEDRNKEIRKEVVTLFNDAKFETKTNFKVNFSFTFNRNGEIVVLDVDSARKDIKNYLRNNVNSKKIPTPGIENHVYKMCINVKVKK